MKRLPLIGVSCDTHPGKSNKGLRECYSLKRVYVDVLTSIGAAAVILPYTKDKAVINEYLNSLSGVLISGAEKDIPPEMYGQKNISAIEPNEERASFEKMLFLETLKTRVPVLAICGGMQLINVALEGTLYQDISTQINHCFEHEQKIPHSKPSHRVTVKKSSRLLLELTSTDTLMVNSTHHQAVRILGRGLINAAEAPDGVIEAVELKNHPFCIGVQWHPERMWKNYLHQRKLLEGFVLACKKSKKK